ncbi:MAG: nuclear transport factor 2 family protein [Planctomycetes bacterium]|nr:nuclear transport factor 2 family protein [Planctomycetota bacterium]
MNRQVMLLGAALTLLGGALLFAQAPKSGPISGSAPDKARLEQVLAAWASRDVSRPAVFYAKDPDLAFYDIAPRKYKNWAEYEKGAADLFKTLKSLTFKLGDDVQVHHAGNVAWATATVDGDMVNNDGSSLKIDGRWTTVWERRGNAWLIVHDHFSMPLPEPTPKSTATSARVPR